MQMNGMPALDYEQAGDALTLTFYGVGAGELENMDWSYITVQTDDGDTVETFAGYALRQTRHDIAHDTWTATLTRALRDETRNVIDTLNARVTENSADMENITAALIELAGMIAAEEPAPPNEVK